MVGPNGVAKEKGILPDALFSCGERVDYFLCEFFPPFRIDSWFSGSP
jgi:hypothetical protein